MLQAAIPDTLAYGEEMGCRSFTVGNLGFTEPRNTVRETKCRGNKGKKFRSIVSGMSMGK